MDINKFLNDMNNTYQRHFSEVMEKKIIHENETVKKVMDTQPKFDTQTFVELFKSRDNFFPGVF